MRYSASALSAVSLHAESRGRENFSEPVILPHCSFPALDAPAQPPPQCVPLRKGSTGINGEFLSGVERKLSKEEEDSRAQGLEFGQASGGGLESLDAGVLAFASGIGDRVVEVVE